MEKWFAINNQFISPNLSNDPHDGVQKWTREAITQKHAAAKEQVSSSSQMSDLAKKIAYN